MHRRNEAPNEANRHEAKDSQNGTAKHDEANRCRTKESHNEIEGLRATASRLGSRRHASTLNKHMSESQCQLENHTNMSHNKPSDTICKPPR